MPDHALKKNSGVSHPAVRLFCGYFMSHGAYQIRAIASVEPAAPVQSMGIGMTPSLHEIGQIHQHPITPFSPVVRRVDCEETSRNGVFAILCT